MEQESFIEAARRLRRPALFSPEEREELGARLLTLQFDAVKPLDTGKRPITESPLFGGEAQAVLFW